MPTSGLKRFIHHPRLRALGYFLLQYVIVVVGLIAMAAYTEPELSSRWSVIVALVLWCCWLFFAAEWCFEIVRAANAGRTAGYLFSWPSLVNALAVLPVPLALAASVPAATAWILASFWVFKLVRRSEGLERLGRVIVLEAKPLFGVLTIFMMVLLFSAAAMHLMERETQPAAFGRLSDALWWAIATLTTTGYGDAVPTTPAGRFIAGMVMICGVGVFGLLTGILATGFVDDSRRHNFVRNWNLVKSVPFFRNVEPAGIIEISHMLRRMDVSEGTTIIRRGREGDCMYFVASGEVEVEIGPKPVRLGAGAFFGEMALLGSGIRTATVSATLPSTLLVLEVADFRTLAAHNAALAEAIETEARRRNNETAEPRTEMQATGTDKS